MPSKDKEYDLMTKKASPPSPKFKNMLFAFLIGGAICTLGEAFGMLYTKIGITEDVVKILIPVSLIVLAAILTGIGVFDKIAKYAGAGTLVPITGFANAVVSPAIDTKSEGFIMGVGAKIFTIAGPVILYGVFTSWVLGVIYWITTMF